VSKETKEINKELFFLNLLRKGIEEANKLDVDEPKLKMPKVEKNRWHLSRRNKSGV
jgi:hypothetical protein